MARVLLVSKPVAPPWNDSSKNLVRDLAVGMRRYTPVVLGRRGAPVALGAAVVEALYPASAGGFAPALADQVRVMARLLRDRGSRVWHFFFAPNPRSSQAGSVASALRRRATVQTVCSAPRADLDPMKLLFADRTIVLSRHTERRLLDAGVAPSRIRRIAPSIEPLAPLDDEARRVARRRLGLPVDALVVVYPGDLEVGGGARLSIEAFADAAPKDAHLVVACRAKTARAKDVDAEMRALAAALGLADRTSWLGETREIHALLGASDVVLLPSSDLFAKMDYPLVVIEAMAMERPVVVAADTPAEELADGGAAIVATAERDAVAQCLRTLADDAARRRAIGGAARAAVLERFDRDRMAAAYESVYDELA